MTIKLDEDNITVSPTQIDDTDSPYLTNGEQYVYVDTTNGPVTIQLASSDTVDGAEIRIIDTGESASNNNITIQTEASENINPGSNSSITLTVDGTYVDLFSDGNNWFSDRAVEKTSGQISGLQSLSTDGLQSNVPSTPEQWATLGERSSIWVSDVFNVADDGTVNLTSQFADGQCGLVIIKNRTDGEQAVVAFAASSANILVSSGAWSTSDTDGDNCVFLSANGNYVIKNRTGGNKEYGVVTMLQD
jgi:hypothetical protein